MKRTTWKVYKNYYLSQSYLIYRWYWLKSIVKSFFVWRSLERCAENILGHMLVWKWAMTIFRVIVEINGKMKNKNICMLIDLRTKFTVIFVFSTENRETYLVCIRKTILFYDPKKMISFSVKIKVDLKNLDEVAELKSEVKQILFGRKVAIQCSQNNAEEFVEPPQKAAAKLS